MTQGRVPSFEAVWPCFTKPTSKVQFAVTSYRNQQIRVRKMAAKRRHEEPRGLRSCDRESTCSRAFRSTQMAESDAVQTSARRLSGR